MKKNSILLNVILAKIITALFVITFTATLKAEIKVTAGKVYDIVEVISGDAEKITDFAFLDDNGNKCLLSDYTKGKYVFQNFWGTWCPPCRAEIPDIIKLQSENKEQLIMIGIALERKQESNPKQKVLDFATQQSMNYINFVGPQTIIDKLQKSYKGISAVPTTYLINKDGKIAEKIVGLRNKEQFQTALNNMMKK